MKLFFPKEKGRSLYDSPPTTSEIAKESDGYWSLYELLGRIPSNQPEAIGTYHAIDIALRTGGFTTNIREIFAFAVVHMRLCMKKSPIASVNIECDTDPSAIGLEECGSIREKWTASWFGNQPTASPAAIQRPLNVAISLEEQNPFDSRFLGFWDRIGTVINNRDNTVLIFFRDVRLLPRSVAQKLPLLTIVS